LVDSAPASLDTLNELASALGDDVNFSTTVTNSIATKMPLAGGTFSGDVALPSSSLFIGKSASDYDGGVFEATSGGTFVSRSGTPFGVNRNGSFNQLINFYKDGANVGVLGTPYGNELYIEASGANSSGLTFTSGNSIQPRKNSASDNGNIDLGTNGNKFKDLHLAGALKANTATFEGNVGINDDTPNEGKLVVRGDAGSNALFVGGNSTSGNSWGLGVNAGSTSGDASFRVYDKDGSNPYLYVRGDGNTGISTANPLAPLHVVGQNGILIDEQGNGDSQLYFGGLSGTDRTYLSRSSNDFLMWNVSDGIIKFANNNAERMSIGSGSGNVFIRTGNLQFGASGSEKGQIEINSTRLLLRSTGDASGIRFDASGITPFKNGSESNGGVDLGHGSAKFYDLHLTNRVKVGSGGGIDFAATSDASGMTNELLDDYEEGTWTPLIKDAASGNAAGMATQSGYYTKVGNIVYVIFACQINSVSGMTSANTVCITGLPFTVNSDTAGGSETGSGLITYINNLDSGDYGQIYARANNSTTHIELIYSGTTYTSTAGHAFQVGYFDSGADTFMAGSCLYRV
jgi:hypothetical protein